YRLAGPFNPAAGHRFEPRSIVVDPYARALSGGHTWGVAEKVPGQMDGIPARRGRLIFDEFDWGNDSPPRTPLSDSILYELHVRGYTQHPSSGVTQPGTFLGLCEKIPHLKSIGVTAVQLMPVLEFDELDQTHRNPANGELL